MAIADTIYQFIERLPPTLQAEVLDFAQYLLFRAERDESDEVDWSRFSVAMAMRGMEEEDSPYTMDDLRETYS